MGFIQIIEDETTADTYVQIVEFRNLEVLREEVM